MGKSKQKVKDYNFMNWLDRKQSNKKERQEAVKIVADLVRQDIRDILAKYSA